MESPKKYLESLPDPRIKRKQLHEFQDVIMLVLCGVIAGCDEWTTIEEYAKTKIDFLKTFLKLPNGIPSHDTFGDIFAKIERHGPPRAPVRGMLLSLDVGGM